MPTINSLLTGGISRSIIRGSANTHADISGVNLERLDGVGTQNKKMDLFVRQTGLDPRAVVPTGIDESLIFTKNRRVFRFKGELITEIGTILGHKGIDVFTSAAVADIALNNRVFAALDAVENQMHFGTVEENGKYSRIELDDAITMLPTPNKDYRACGMNGTFIYFLDGETKITRLRLDLEGRIASNTLQETDLPSYSDGTPVGVAVNTNGVAVLYNNKVVRTGTVDAAGDITFNNTLVDFSSIEGSLNKIGCDDSTLVITKDDSVLIASITDNMMTINTATASQVENPPTRRFNRGVDINGDTLMVTEETSVIFASYASATKGLDYDVEADIQDAIQFGDYVYYATNYSIGRFEIGEEFSTRTDMWKSFLNGHAEYHPMEKLADLLYIGDRNVVATVRPDETFIRNALDIPSEYTIRCLLNRQTNLMIGTQGTAISSFGSSRVFIWDNESSSWISSVVIPEESVTAFIDTGLFVILICGRRGSMYYTDSYNTRLLKRIGDEDSDTEILPRHIISWEGQSYLALNNRIYSVFGTYINAGNTGGTNSILCGEYKIDTEVVANRDIDILFVQNRKLSSIRNDGIYALSDNHYEDIEISTRLMIANDEIPPQPKSLIVSFVRPPKNGTVQVLQQDASGKRMTNLQGSFKHSGFQYAATGMEKRHDLRFIVRIVGGQDFPVQILGTTLTY